MVTQLPDGVRLLRTLTGHGGTIGRIGWSPDGRLLATPSRDGTIRIWDTDSGVCVRAILGRGAMLAAAFDPDVPSPLRTTSAAQGCGAPGKPVRKVMGLAVTGWAVARWKAQETGRGAKPGDRARLLLRQLGDHVQDPRIRPPEIGLGLTQRA